MDKKIAYLGPEGTYTEQAAEIYSHESRKIACNTIEDVFSETTSRKAAIGIVPIENIIEGPVNETLDKLLKYNGRIKIIDTIILPIQHSIGCLPESKGIKKIMSKDQALSQCSDYLHKNYNKAELIKTDSTAKAIEKIASNNILDAAAIGNEPAFKKYGLKILEKDIGNTKGNKTKFAVLGNHIPEKTGKDCTTVMIYPQKDRVGLLDDIVEIISRKYKINMSSIHSRPDTLGGHRFYLDLEGHVKDTKIKNCIKDLKDKLDEDYTDVEIFGSYPRRDLIEKRIRTVGIIGGTGKMGQLLRPFLEQAGYNVIISGRKTELNYEECIKRSDAVIVNVPIKNTIEIIKKIGPYFKNGKLIVDNTSIKTQPIEAMLRYTGKNAEVLGMHTIFGPKAGTVHGQNVAFVHTPKSGEKSREFENIFYKYGAKIIQTTAEEHDKEMAFHQNLEHFTKIALSEIIRKKFKNPERLEGFSSPNSENSLITMGRILSSEPELLAEIQEFNKQSPGMIEEYLKTINKIGKMLINKDTKYFKQLINEGRSYFGEKWIKDKVLKSKKIQEALSKKD
jgi:chorismate mutase/prephenate dehydratase